MTEDDEIRYIAQKILQQKAISQEEGYELGIGELVRVVVPKKTLTKTRYKLSPVHYQIVGKEGLNYIIQADDGTTTRRTRAHLVPQFSGTKKAKTVEGAQHGVVSEIVDYDAKKRKYDVVFEMPDGSKVPDTIPMSYLREGNPTSMSPLEKDFWLGVRKKRIGKLARSRPSRA